MVLFLFSAAAQGYAPSVRRPCPRRGGVKKSFFFSVRGTRRAAPEAL